MQRRPMVLVVNPHAGGGRGGRVLGATLAALRTHGIEPDVVVCRSGDEPTRVGAQAAAAGAGVVVAVGGDGHAAAVAHGLIGTPTALAVVPAGSANDYAVALGMPRRDPAAAVAHIVAG